MMKNETTYNVKAHASVYPQPSTYYAQAHHYTESPTSSVCLLTESNSVELSIILMQVMKMRRKCYS
jgi:hypothetical protein